MPADRGGRGLARVHLDAECRSPRSELSVLDHSARPRPGAAKFDAQFGVSGHLPRPLRYQPMQGVRPRVGGEAVLDPPIIQSRVAEAADPGRHHEAPKVEYVLALRDQEFVVADTE
jgi:hypothetical protein